MTPIAYWIASALVISYSSHVIFKIIKNKPLDKVDRLMIIWVILWNLLVWVMVMLEVGG